MSHPASRHMPGGWWRRPLLAAVAALLGVGSANARDASVCPAAVGVAASAPPSAVPAAASTPATIGAPAAGWQGVRVVVDADDLRVCADGRLLLSLRAQSAQSLRREFPGEWPFLAVNYEVRALSMIGPYLSVEERRSTENPATYLRERVRTYDLRTPGRELTLDELFGDPALVQALQRSPLLRQTVGIKALARAAAGADTRTLSRRLAEVPATDRQGKTFLPPGWLGGFWITAVRGTQVQVGLALPRYSGMREETLVRGSLLLPLPAELSVGPLAVAPTASASAAATSSPPGPALPADWARWAYAERP